MGKLKIIIQIISQIGAGNSYLPNMTIELVKWNIEYKYHLFLLAVSYN